jgi:protein-disulfide isomerase
MKTGKYLVGLALALLAGGAVMGLRAANPRTKPYAIDLAKIEGTPNAPVTIFVFNDFLCHYSRDLYPFLDQLVAENPGKVKVVYKHFSAGYRRPDHSRWIAEASECAAEQGRFFDFRNYLAAHLTKYANAKDYAPIMKIYAREIGLDSPRFETCLESRGTSAIIARDMEEARLSGVYSTPTIIIGGRKIVGGEEAEIEDLVSREIRRLKA